MADNNVQVIEADQLERLPDEESSDSGSDHGNENDLTEKLRKTQGRVNGLKQTISHLESFIASAQEYSKSKDAEIVELTKKLKDLESKKGITSSTAANGVGNGNSDKGKKNGEGIKKQKTGTSK